MIVLGVDPPNGSSVADGSRLLFHKQWPKTPDEAALAERIEHAVRHALDLEAQLLAIEGQFGEWRDSIPKDVRAGLVRSSLVLASRAGQWKQEWLRQSRERRGVSSPIVVRPAPKWRRAVFGKLVPKHSKEVNAFIVSTLSNLYSVDLGEDEANAVGIALSVSNLPDLECLR